MLFRSPILMEIPFDRKIAETYAKGSLLIEDMPEYKEKFQALLEKILRLVEKKGGLK